MKTPEEWENYIPDGNWNELEFTAAIQADARKGMLDPGCLEGLLREWRWKLYDACGEIEKLPASEQESKAVAMVSAVAFAIQNYLMNHGMDNRPLEKRPQQQGETT
jgi:hypothetical protein